MDSIEIASKYRSSYVSSSNRFQEKGIYWFSIQSRKTYLAYQNHKAVILFSFKRKEEKSWAYSFNRYQGESCSIKMQLVFLDI